MPQETLPKTEDDGSVIDYLDEDGLEEGIEDGTEEGIEDGTDIVVTAYR